MSKLFPNKAEKAMQEKLRIKEARDSLNGVMNKMTTMYEQLRARADKLEELIMESLAKGDKLRAKLDCMELKMNKEQSEMCGFISMAIRKKQLEFENSINMGEAAAALKSVSGLGIKSTDMDVFFVQSEKNPLWTLIKDEMQSMTEDQDVSDMMAQFEARFAQTQMSSVASPLETNNTTSYKTNN